MGKSIMKVSRWSIRSLVILYGKAATLFFALICVLTGLTARSVAAGTSSVTARTYKGKVLFSSDSTFVKNVKLYLCSVAYPVYGIPAGEPIKMKVDSTTSDSNGNFTFSPSSEPSAFLLTTADKIKHNSTTGYIYATPEVRYPSGKDTTFTLYMSPIPGTSVKQTVKSTPDYNHSVIAGGIVSIVIPGWQNSSLSATVVNSMGEKVTSAEALDNGTIRWNTSNVSKGYYMLHISNGSGTIAAGVVVK
ncbi:MAG: T9SS type A sorting domain-containing protein [Fibrobacterota bacterium]